MNRRTMLLALLIALLSMLAVAPVGAAAVPQAPAGIVTDVPVKGTVENGGTFVGTLDLLRFVRSGERIVVVGELSGTLRNASGQVIGSVSDVAVRIPLTVHRASCEMLHLALGPYTLELLNLDVTVNRVIVEITDDAAPGRLLDNLLCAIARHVERGSRGGALPALLNNLLRVLG